MKEKQSSSFYSLSLSLRLREEMEESYLRSPWLLAPYFQGVMMQRISSEYASRLHGFEVNPYSQSLFYDRQKKRSSSAIFPENLTWRINTLNEDAYTNILRALNDEAFQAIELKATGHIFRVVEKTVYEFPLASLAKLFYDEPVSNRFRIDILSPTAFKQQGKYVFLPDIHLIVQSLQQKYNAIHEGSKEVAPEELAEMVSRIVITSYRLQSRYFKVGTSYIPAFMGSLQLAVKGSKTLQSYLRMLLKFGEFSGLGIKAGMGMGAIRTENLAERIVG